MSLDFTAIILATVVPLSALMMAALTGWQLNRNKKEDWLRQDKVAARLERAQEKAAIAAAEQTAVLNQVHKLVNSNMTAAMESELLAHRSMLSMMRQQSDPDPEMLATIASAQAKVTQLAVALEERQRATIASDQAIASAAMRAPAGSTP